MDKIEEKTTEEFINNCVLSCNFCHKPRQHVKYLIHAKGQNGKPDTYICDECVILSQEIVDAENDKKLDRTTKGEWIFVGYKSSYSTEHDEYHSQWMLMDTMQQANDLVSMIKRSNNPVVMKFVPLEKYEAIVKENEQLKANGDSIARSQSNE